MRELTVAVLITAFVVIGCGGGNDYPASAQRNFVESCEQNGGSTKACDCALDKIQDDLSYQEFKREDVAIRAGRPPSREVTDALADCDATSPAEAGATAEGDGAAATDAALTDALREAAPAAADTIADARIEDSLEPTLVIVTAEQTNDVALEGLRNACANLAQVAAETTGTDVAQVTAQTDVGQKNLCTM